MKYWVLFSLCFLILPLRAQDPTLDWANPYPSSGFLSIQSMTTDTAGNVISTGWANGTVDFDPGPGSLTLSPLGQNDAFVQKVDNNGDLLWAHLIGGTWWYDQAVDVVTDVAGNIYVTGEFRSTVDFDPGPGVFQLSSVEDAVFLLALNSNGDFLFAKKFEGQNVSGITPGKMAIDDQRNIYLTGEFSGPVDFDPGPNTLILNTIGGQDDLYVVKLNPQGDLIWVNDYGDATGNLYGWDIAVSHTNDVLVTGHFNNSTDFNPGGTPVILSPVGTLDNFILKLDENGAFVWARSVGSDQQDYSIDIEVDLEESVIVTGWYEDSIDMNPGPGVDMIYSFGNRDTYVLKLDTNGDYVWGKSLGAPGFVTPADAIIDDANSVYICGDYFGLSDFDPNAGVDIQPPYGNTDMFICKLDSAGNAQWSIGTGGNAVDRYESMTMDEKGDLFLYGLFSNTVDIDPSPTVQNIVSQGNFDNVMVKFNPCEDFGVDRQFDCVSYTWQNGITYTQNEYAATMTFTNQNGCDSIVRLHLDVGIPETMDIQTSCDSLTWLDGNTYTSSITGPTMVYTSVQGCDSTVILDLTINNSTTATDVQTACAAYTWIDGNTYAASIFGPTWIIPSSIGCDSTVTLDLTILQPSFATDVQQACDSYTWIDGITYTTSNNTATHILTNAVGCDSVITLDLTVISSTTATDVVTACESYTWLDGNTYTTSNNSATFVVPNSVGCDSLITLDLTINNATTGTDLVSACDSYTWIDGNVYTSSNSTATHIITNSFGCDSIVTLDLTINSANINVNQNGIELIADPGATTYQWLDCLNGYAQIPGETSNTFIASANGEYAVEVLNNGCTDTSACFIVDNVGLITLNTNDLVVHPNPTTGEIFIKAANKLEIESVELRSISGQLIAQYPFAESYQLNVIPGTYFLVFKSRTQVVSRSRIVVK